MLQLVVLKVSVVAAAPAPPTAEDTSPSLVFPLATATVTVAVGALASATVKLSVAPVSLVRVEPPLSTTVSPARSSSALVTLTVTFPRAR